MKIAGRQKRMLEKLKELSPRWVQAAVVHGRRHSHHAGTLRRLVAKGLAERRPPLGCPLTYEYRITPAGRRVLEASPPPVSVATNLIRQIVAMVGDNLAPQAATAAILGVGQPSVSRYLEGSPPEPAVIFRACLALQAAGAEPDGYNLTRCDSCGVVTVYEGDRLIHSGPPPVAPVPDAATVTG